MQGRILVVNRLIEELGSIEEYHVEFADTRDHVRVRFESESYDLLLYCSTDDAEADHEFLSRFKSDPATIMIACIVVTDRYDIDEKARYLFLGVDYYLSSPVDPRELKASIYRLLKRANQFEQVAFRDALTGAYNRRFFESHSLMELQRAKKMGIPMSLSLLDIDRFKQVNDTYGHPFGDLVLQGLSHMLDQQIRPTDFYARLGGEEFVVLLHGADEEEAGKEMRRILEYVNMNPIAQNEGSEFFVTFSAGVVQWDGEKSISEWLKSADQGLYQAKEAGRNRIMTPKGNVAAQKSGNDGKQKLILIVDDEEMQRGLIAAAFAESSNIKVRTASNALEALELLRKNRFDLCILDDEMPKTDGYGLMKIIKHEEQWRNIPVLMLSAKKTNEAIRALNSGADDFISKPFAPMELEFRTKSLL
jgi:two-component system cell cycle response regulator